MATVKSRQEEYTEMEALVGLAVHYQKHKPGVNLNVERLPRDVFRIESVHRFGKRVVINDGIIVMEDVPAVIMRGGRAAFLLPTGEELYFFVVE
ncbi:UNVERIFIED_CONTAM: hypothetical protein ABID98_003936 [Brevibacillus sp. OAP136]